MITNCKEKKTMAIENSHHQPSTTVEGLADDLVRWALSFRRKEGRPRREMEPCLFEEGVLGLPRYGPDPRAKRQGRPPW